MPDPGKDFVALFIDWDNLAISTAADLGGASPDVRRIVQTAQQFGVVLIARAYAEWTSTSERLGVYRAGIETVYAPTFRYENDPITQAPRGKSLADPCMVADCVDILHLLPSITTFVIVSGDKDLIPVVRLAQLRGKRVVVIGPDYAAGVLREIADEFICYRKVVEADEGSTVLGDTVDPIQANRRRQPARVGAVQQAESSSANSSRASRVVRNASVPMRQRNQDGRRPAGHAEVHSVGGSLHDVLAAEPAIKSDAEPEPAEKQVPDLQSVFAAVLEILRQRTSDGKPRTRATNLKDALMIKLPGFSERRYGFSKFKDFLTAMEKTGDINVTSAGPVHWVSLPNAIVAEPEAAATQVVEQPIDTPRAQQEAIDLSDDAQQAELVSFLVDLRNRSRWLTYTYVLTNLITHMGKTRPGTNAEAAARSVLNQLVQNGVLKVDREPQEVEVGGIKHRVRMCHLQESHQVVSQIVANREVEAARAELEHGVEVQPAESTMDEAQPLAEAQPDGVSYPTSNGIIEPPKSPTTDEARFERLRLQDEPIDRGLAQGQSIEAQSIEERPGESQSAALQWCQDEHVEDHSVEVVPEESLSPKLEAQTWPIATQSTEPEPERQAQPQTDAWPESAGLVDDLQRVLLETGRLSGIEAQRADEEKPLDLSQPEPPPALVSSSGSSFDEALQALRKIVLESTNRNKPRVGIAGLKAKLNGVLGHFDEQEFGFSKFKDFVAAAEKAGYIRIEKVGSTTWLSVEMMPGEQAGGFHEDQPSSSIRTGDAPQPNNGGKPGGASKRRRSSRKKAPAESAISAASL